MYAAKAGRTESAKILLKKGAQLASKDLKGLTALHHAARSYQPKFIKTIIKQGIPVDIKDKKQLTALHHAISGEVVTWSDVLLCVMSYTYHPAGPH